MIHALLLATLAAGPAQYDQAFWERDLHGLVVLLSERPSSEAEAEAQALYGDVVRLVQCEPLPGIAAGDLQAVSQRRLLRLEAARRTRLGADAARAPTLWREVLDPASFRRTSALAAQGLLLRWPVEEERWSDEATDVAVRPSACANPVAAGDELSLLGAPELTQLQLALPADAGARLTYHRAARLLARGEREAARAARQHERAVLDRGPRHEGAQHAPRGGLGEEEKRTERTDLGERVGLQGAIAKQDRSDHPEEAAAREGAQQARGHAGAEGQHADVGGQGRRAGRG